MNETKFLLSMHTYFCLLLLLFVGVKPDQLRIYNNPLNNKAVDLFLLVDETNFYLNQIQLGQIKIALNAIANDLQPLASSPYFGIFFYGATSAVDTVVPFMTNYATVVKGKLDQKQYTRAQLNPSTLMSALDSVDASCQLHCRANIPRVTVVFTSMPDYLAESRIRQLENNRSMTVIVVGIGSIANTATLDSLASHPSRIYAVPFANFAELIVSASYISSLISSVPRLLPVGYSLGVWSASKDVYYTVQANTFGFISTSDIVIVFTTNCNNCSVFASMSEPNPTSVNAAEHTNRQYFYAPGYTYSVLYFRIPKNTKRFFLSFLGSGMSSVTAILNVFNMPQIMPI